MLWLDGLYDTGLTVGFLLAVALLIVAYWMTRATSERIFSWPVLSLGCMGACCAGYFYEVHRTLVSGLAGMTHI
jgi:hypothetical protein